MQYTILKTEKIVFLFKSHALSNFIVINFKQFVKMLFR